MSEKVIIIRGAPAELLLAHVAATGMPSMATH